jgi:hypothetical protein
MTCEGRSMPQRSQTSFTPRISDVATLAAGFVDFDVLGDELAEVLVRRDHEGLHARFVRACGQDADDVVRLVAVAHEDRHIHGLQQAFDLRDGHAMSSGISSRCAL